MVYLETQVAKPTSASCQWFYHPRDLDLAKAALPTAFALGLGLQHTHFRGTQHSVPAPGTDGKATSAGHKPGSLGRATYAAWASSFSPTKHG